MPPGPPFGKQTHEQLNLASRHDEQVFRLSLPLIPCCSHSECCPSESMCPAYLNPVLLGSECFHWIQPGSTPGGSQTGQNRNRQQRRNDLCGGEWKHRVGCKKSQATGCHSARPCATGAGLRGEAVSRLHDCRGCVRVAQHHWLYAARAHLMEREGNRAGAAANYQRAADRTASLPERNYLVVQVARLRESL